jgi:hypothetical protein
MSRKLSWWVPPLHLMLELVDNGSQVDEAEQAAGVATAQLLLIADAVAIAEVCYLHTHGLFDLTRRLDRQQPLLVSSSS